MNIQERFTKILQASPQELSEIDKILVSGVAAIPSSVKLWTMGDASRETGLSRVTLWRAIKEGRIKAVTIRKKSKRISDFELRKFINGET